MARQTPSFVGLRPASERASAAARGASRKRDTRCEVALRSALFKAGCRFRKNVAELPGRPDVVFTKARVAVFCDGDFWHGKDWRARQAKLRRGTNAQYWIAKIERNMIRDRQSTRSLLDQGWTVIRFWESDILQDPVAAAHHVLDMLDRRGHRRRLTGQGTVGENGANEA